MSSLPTRVEFPPVPARPVLAPLARAPWFRGWAVAGAVVAVTDAVLLAIAVIAC